MKILIILLFLISCANDNTSHNEEIWHATKGKKQIYLLGTSSQNTSLSKSTKTLINQSDGLMLESSILDRINVADELKKSIEQHRPNFLVKDHLPKKEWEYFKKVFSSPSITKEISSYGKKVSLKTISLPYAMFLILRASGYKGDTSFLPSYTVEKLNKTPKGTRQIKFHGRVNMNSLESKIETYAADISKYPKSLVSPEDQKEVAYSNFSFSGEQSLEFIQFLFIKDHPLPKEVTPQAPRHKRVNWLEKILDYNKLYDSLFIAVEIEHLEGEKNLLNEMKADGYQITKYPTGRL